MAVVKRRMVQLLPEICIFLDIDDLAEIKDLEKYVEQTGCVLVFISRGYFYSTNCMREAQAACDQKKSVVLLREGNLNRGGITLEDSMKECAARPAVRDYLFNERPVVVWMRVQEHQLESLRQIAMSMLLTTPRYEMLDGLHELKLYCPGSIRMQRLRMQKPTILYHHSANHGAKEAAEDVCTRLRQVNVTAVSDVDPESLSGVTMLLYLNKHTWEDTQFALDVMAAYEEAIPIIMVHEADETRGGCDFGHFFQTT